MKRTMELTSAVSRDPGLGKWPRYRFTIEPAPRWATTRSIPPNWPRASASNCCTMPWSCTRTICDRARRRPKTRAEVAGSSKKMYRQKGTGNARAGSRRSGIRRGGGHIKAKQPRDWSYRLPKKALRLATRMAVATRLADDEVTLIDNLSFEQPKTSAMAAVLTALKLADTSLLVAVAGHDVNVYKSLRNLANVSVAPVAD